MDWLSSAMGRICVEWANWRLLLLLVVAVVVVVVNSQAHETDRFESVACVR